MAEQYTLRTTHARSYTSSANTRTYQCDVLGLSPVTLCITLCRGVAAIVGAIAFLCVPAGCISIPYWNPDFPATRSLVKQETTRMKSEPVKRARPLVILSGYRSPWIAADTLGAKLQALTHTPDDQILIMSYPFAASIQPLANRVIRTIETRWPSDDPAWTTEVDVVGYSMGGIVARLAAAGPRQRSNVCNDTNSTTHHPRKRLHIHSLYTLATPHTGAAFADFGTTSSAVRDMTRGSRLLKHLDTALTRDEYELVCYAVLEDKIVGARRTYPYGSLPFWVDGLVVFSHFHVAWDTRIIADVALRLRNETPIAIRPTRPPRH